MKLNQKAWAILTEEEKIVLQLNLSLNKSTWKTGEIVKKSHYKLIEIKDRAKTFLRIFTHFFNEYNSLIPESVKISPDLKEYLILTIRDRVKTNQAYKQIDNPFYHRVKSRDEVIAEEISKWKSSLELAERDLYNLVIEFDRWNNFRILPKSIQEPSAFKRRDKNKLKKHLKIASTISPLSYLIIKKKFKYKTRHKIKAAYLVFVREPMEEGQKRKIKIIKVKAEDKHIAELSKASLFLFPTEELAREYGKLIYDFTHKESKHCIDGLKFWPLYREIIQKALNFEKIQNISPQRRYLEYADKKKAKIKN